MAQEAENVKKFCSIVTLQGNDYNLPFKAISLLQLLCFFRSIKIIGDYFGVTEIFIKKNESQINKNDFISHFVMNTI